VAAFERSLEIQSRLPEPFETGRTLLALGSLLRRSQKKSRARLVLEEARATFEQLEAAVWEARANAELARIGGRAARSDGLTPTEDRIAQLVAAGKSNHQIASALVISTRTVEWNLTKVYRKLGVTSRTELAVKLGKR
jgi:DNA-binding NarL/FixJ family response regulator